MGMQNFFRQLRQTIARQYIDFPWLRIAPGWCAMPPQECAVCLRTPLNQVKCTNRTAFSNNLINNLLGRGSYHHESLFIDCKSKRKASGSRTGRRLTLST
jgi:hypothetical protein